MSITAVKKQELIAEYARFENDTGSPEIQCAILTERINKISEHLKENHKDHHSRRGLLKLVSRRRKLLDYLNRHSSEKYLEMIKKLKLRK